MSGDLWWGLPGPRRFLRRVAEDVEEGRSVIIALPKPMADGRWSRRLEEARVTRLRDSLPAADIRVCPNPMAVVRRHLLPSGSDVTDSVPALCDEVARAFEEASGNGGPCGASVAVLECAGDWPSLASWTSFLNDWARASRNKPLTSRIVFIAIVGGARLAQLPPDQDSLRTRAWDAVTDEADMLTHSHVAFADWPGTALNRRVAAGVAASLAIWDPDVVNALADARLQDLLKPQAILRRLAKDRGWTRTNLARGVDWEQGHQATVAGSLRMHSAALALLGEDAKVESRVWIGQVGVLLPFVEERRLELIQQLRPMLRIPWPTRFAQITDVFDLEISHLCEQAEALRLPLAITSALPVLRHIRNKLSHLEVVDSETLSDERLGSELSRRFLN